MRTSVREGLVTFSQFEFTLDLRIFPNFKFQTIRSVMMLLLACSIGAYAYVRTARTCDFFTIRIILDLRIFYNLKFQTI